MEPHPLFDHDTHVFVILDVVNYSFRVAQDESEATRIKEYLAQIGRDAKRFGYHQIGQPGDACVLVGDANHTKKFLQFMHRLFVPEKNQPPKDDHEPLRVIAHLGCVGIQHQDGKVSDYSGKDVIKTYRLEKESDAGEIVITDTLYRPLQRHLRHFIIRTDGPKRSRTIKGLDTIQPFEALWLLDFPTGDAPIHFLREYLVQKDKL